MAALQITYFFDSIEELQDHVDRLGSKPASKKPSKPRPTKPREQVEEVAAEPAESDVAPESTLEDLKKAVLGAVKRVGKAKAEAAMKKFGASTIREVGDDTRDQVVAALEALK